MRPGLRLEARLCLFTQAASNVAKQYTALESFPQVWLVDGVLVTLAATIPSRYLCSFDENALLVFPWRPGNCNLIRGHVSASCLFVHQVHQQSGQFDLRPPALLRLFGKHNFPRHLPRVDGGPRQANLDPVYWCTPFRQYRSRWVYIM